MIRKIHIKNFKSIDSLDMELGRVNVFIGENGCGKSNILEAIAMASANFNGNLGNEFLVSRGIRTTTPPFMRAAFDKSSMTNPIEIRVEGESDDERYRCVLQNDNKPYSQWVDTEYVYYTLRVIKEIVGLLDDDPEGMELIGIQNDEDSPLLSPSSPIVDDVYSRIKKTRQKRLSSLHLGNFLTFAPLNDALRNFEKEGQIEPLGVNGEGLFRLLKYMATEEDSKEEFALLKETLQFLDWFDDFAISEDPMVGDRHIKLRDRYLDEESGFFDQRSANEGFLYILFYFALFISKHTPSFFAIDNIDASLNPKLCQALMKELAILAKKRNKQVLLTTHNPAILDGLNINDPEQRLFVVKRSRAGKTMLKNITKKPSRSDDRPVKLSEAFMNGFLGGLPKNF